MSVEHPLMASVLLYFVVGSPWGLLCCIFWKKCHVSREEQYILLLFDHFFFFFFDFSPHKKHFCVSLNTPDSWKSIHFFFFGLIEMIHYRRVFFLLFVCLSFLFRRSATSFFWYWMGEDFTSTFFNLTPYWWRRRKIKNMKEIQIQRNSEKRTERGPPLSD